MKLLVGAGCALCVLALVWARPEDEPKLTLLFSGDIRGYLQPCGCTKPQVGGVLRLASVAKTLLKQPNSFYVDCGNWSGGLGRQNELKSETLAENFRNLGAAYVNVGTADRKVGEETLKRLQEIAGGVIGGMAEEWSETHRKTISGEFTLEGVANFSSTLQNDDPSKVRIVLFSGDKAAATKFAQANQDVSLLIYSSQGDPLKQPMKVGRCTLVSIGDKCRYLGKIDFVNGEWTGFKAIELNSGIEDDSSAAASYKNYLKRVSLEKLLDNLPRTKDGPSYVGSKKCAPCHQKEYKIWKSSPHFFALGNDADPECVYCHVTGIEHLSGFRSKEQTPDLAHVGCENCHGAGSAHIANLKAPYGRSGEAACLKCHDLDNSPYFDFQKYWPKIAH